MGRRSGLVCRRGQVISPRLHELGLRAARYRVADVDTWLARQG